MTQHQANPFRVVPLFAALGVIAGGVVLSGCAHVKVDPIQVQTIHIVHDVNIRVDKALDDYFARLDRETTAATPPATTESAQAIGDKQ
jgi:hypothetical protein